VSKERAEKRAKEVKHAGRLKQKAIFNLKLHNSVVKELTVKKKEKKKLKTMRLIYSNYILNNTALLGFHPSERE